MGDYLDQPMAQDAELAAACGELPPRVTSAQPHVSLALGAPAYASTGSAINTPVRLSAADGSVQLADATPTNYILRGGVVGMPVHEQLLVGEPSGTSYLSEPVTIHVQI